MANKKERKISEKRKHQYEMIGLNISYYRKFRKRTQISLANEINISRSYLSCIENVSKEKVPSLEVLLDIADALDVDIHQLLDFTRYNSEEA